MITTETMPGNKAQIRAIVEECVAALREGDAARRRPGAEESHTWK
jgi:hypothetical protein